MMSAMFTKAPPDKGVTASRLTPLPGVAASRLTPCSPLFIAKYKPYSLDGFFASPKFKSVLRTLLDADDLNILFIGNTCSGKTILLHTLIREYYGLAPTQPVPENNLLYVNNLKEQGVSFFRSELKTFSQSHSTIYGKKKMVIIDDIDTMNEQSQQVFRNYIDKYRHNVHFLSVCTNIQKVIESIQSRTHIITIPTMDSEQIKTVMERIIREEHLLIDVDAKEYLFSISNNSIRCLINNLEKIFIIDRHVTLDLCKKLCSNISFQLFEDYVDCIKSDNLVGAIQVLYGIYDYGYSVIDILDYFFTFVKTTELLDEEQKYQIIPVLCKYITLFHNLHEDNIELALFTNTVFDVIRGSG